MAIYNEMCSLEKSTQNRNNRKRCGMRGGDRKRKCERLRIIINFSFGGDDCHRNKNFRSISTKSWIGKIFVWVHFSKKKFSALFFCRLLFCFQLHDAHAFRRKMIIFHKSCVGWVFFTYRLWICLQTPTLYRIYFRTIKAMHFNISPISFTSWFWLIMTVPLSQNSTIFTSTHLYTHQFDQDKMKKSHFSLEIC